MRSAANCVGLAVLASSLGAFSAMAQTPQTIGHLTPPREVGIYVSSALKSQDFVGELMCALKRVVVAPVNRHEIDMRFDQSLLANPRQFDVAKVDARFRQLTALDSADFKYLLMPYDLKAQPYNYVFAQSFGLDAPRKTGLISTARLDIGNPLIEHHDGVGITALRVYKLALKSIARLAGLASPDRCILVFPRNLDELDRKSAEFCPEDHDALVDADVLKGQESDTGDCMLVSGREPAVRLAAANGD